MCQMLDTNITVTVNKLSFVIGNYSLSLKSFIDLIEIHMLGPFDRGQNDIKHGLDLNVCDIKNGVTSYNDF